MHFIDSSITSYGKFDSRMPIKIFPIDESSLIIFATTEETALGIREKSAKHFWGIMQQKTIKITKCIFIVIFCIRSALQSILKCCWGVFKLIAEHLIPLISC